MIMDLYDSETDRFTRGVYEGNQISMVAKVDPDYLLYLVENGDVDDATTDIIEQFVDDNPELFEGLLD